MVIVYVLNVILAIFFRSFEKVDDYGWKVLEFLRRKLPRINVNLQKIRNKMFKLKLPTDPRWANIAEGNLEEILTDHAWCEKKLPLMRLVLITMIPEHTEIVTELLAIAQEEMVKFQSSSRNQKKRLYFRKNQKRRLCKSTFKFIIQK